MFFSSPSFFFNVTLKVIVVWVTYGHWKPLQLNQSSYAVCISLSIILNFVFKAILYRMRVCLMRAEHLIGGDVVNDWTNPHCFFLSIAYTRFASSIVDCCGIPCQEVSHRFSIWVFWINIKLSLSQMRTNERTNKQRSQWKYQSNRLQRSNEFKWKKNNHSNY